MQSILVIDAGTTSFKVAMFDESLQLRGLASREFDIIRPTTDRAELAPQKYWSSCVEAIREALGKSPLDPQCVAAIAVTGHTDTLFAIDANGQPVANAILWSDPRHSVASRTNSTRNWTPAALSNYRANRCIVGAFRGPHRMDCRQPGRVGRTYRALSADARLLAILPDWPNDN